MKLGIMQPYFFPYLGHFSLIAYTDEWIVFDTTQYTPKAWMNRNRVLHPVDGWNYISIPLQHSSISIKTYEARIQDVTAVHKQVLGKLSHYKKRAPYYSRVESLVHEVFQEQDDDSLVNLNVRGLKCVCRYLEIPFNYKICSEMNLTLPESMPAGKWAPTISGLLGAAEYVNPIGGKELFNPDDFTKLGVELRFLKATEFQYDTKQYRYESGLSILDVLMWNDPEIVREAVHRFEILKPE